MNVYLWAVVLALVAVCGGVEQKKTNKVEKKAETLQSSESYPLPGLHGGYGYMKKGYGEFGYGTYGDHGSHGDRAHGAYGAHAARAYKDYDGYGAHGGALDRYRGVDGFARSKGAGYERAFAYDKKAGFRDHGGDRAAYADHYGRHGRYGEHGAAAYGRHGYDRFGASDKYGSHGFGGYGHDGGAYGNYGHSAMYFKAPGYGYHY